MIQQPHSWAYIQTKLQFKETRTPLFMAALFTAAKACQQPSCPLTDGWVKMWYVRTMEYYSAIQKNEIVPFAATRMELETLVLSEVSQKEKDKYHITYLESNIRHK